MQHGGNRCIRRISEDSRLDLTLELIWGYSNTDSRERSPWYEIALPVAGARQGADDLARGSGSEVEISGPGVVPTECIFLLACGFCSVVHTGSRGENACCSLSCNTTTSLLSCCNACSTSVKRVSYAPLLASRPSQSRMRRASSRFSAVMLCSFASSSRSRRRSSSSQPTIWLNCVRPKGFFS
jgi:hypothetical protein